MSKYFIKGETLTGIANEIRTLSGTTEPMGLDAMAVNINTANTEVASQVELISQLEEVINSLPDVSSITPTLQEKTITPTASTQNVLPDNGYDGLSKVVVNGDENLIADNIKSGISIFGVEGTHEGGNLLIGSYTYSGSNQPIDDGDGNWRIKFLSSGTLTVEKDSNVDIFAVGGGGNGGLYSSTNAGGGGGAGGYTTTTRNVKLEKDKTYVVTVGAANGTSSLTNEEGTAICEAAGGGNASSSNGGSGGSGGAGGAYYGVGATTPGSDGSDAITSSSSASGGIGQGSTTREFGEADGDLYAGGGGGGRNSSAGASAGADGGGGDGASNTVAAKAGGENTGGGGGGSSSYTVGITPGTGGSGIVIIRNARVITA